MTIRTRYGSVALPLVVMVGGCASTPAIRNLTDRTATSVQSIDENVASFVTAQNRLSVGNAAELDLFGQATTNNKMISDRQRVAWTAAGDSGRDSLYAKVTAMTSADIVARAAIARSVQPTVTSTASYTATITALAKVKAKPSVLNYGLELAEYAGGVVSTYSDLQAKAAKDAKAVADQAQDATAKATATK